MPDDVKSINQHPDALTEYPSISPADVNILVERMAAGTEPENQEHLKASLADFAFTQTIVRNDPKHVPSNKAVYDALSGTRIFSYIGEFSSATPENPKMNDLFLATATFVEDGVTYTQNRFYAWSESTQTWGDVTDEIKGPKGDQGDKGDPPNLSIGTVEYGDTPTVEIDDSDPANPKLNFVLKTSEVGVVDDLESDSQVDALSAKQGKILKGISDNTNADLANTKNRVTSNSQRIANLEDKSEPFTIEYPSSDYGKGTVPASIEKSGMVKKIVGKSRAWNRLCKSVATTTYNDVTFTNNGDGSYTLNGTAGTGGAYNVLFPDSDRIPSHSYMAWDDNNSNLGYGFGLNSTRRTIFPAGYGFNAVLFVAEGVTVSNVVVHPILRDLTAIFGLGNEPLTTADAIKAIPDIVKNEDFIGYSLVNTTITGVEVIGFNRWDEDFQTGYFYNTSTGSKQSSENWNCSRNKQDCVGGVDYYLSVKNKSTFLIHVIWFDANDNYITYVGRSSAGIVTSPSNASKFAMNIAIEEYGGTTYNHDICINKSQPNTSVNSHNGDYLPYQRNTLMLSSPVTPKSAGSVAEVLDVETGKKTRLIGVISGADLVALNWQFYSSPDRFAVAFSAKAENTMVTCNRYTPVSSITGSEDKTISGEAGYLTIIDSAYSSATLADFKAQLSDVEINYALATPLPDEQVCDPSPTALAVEPYGEVSLIQDQDIELDGGFSMRYIPDSAYVKKADIVDNLNSSDVSKPLSANMGRVIGATLDQHDSRITNLEQKAGDYSIVQYRGTDAVPTGKAKYGLVKSIVGKTRAWNRLVKNGNFADGTSYWAGRDGDSVSVSDGVLTLTASSGTLKGLSSDASYYNVIAGHKYMVSGYVKSSISGIASLAFSNFSGTHSISANQWTNVSRIIDQGITENVAIYFLVSGDFNGGETIQYKNIIVRDLTVIFPEGVPSTISECVQKCPDLLKWDAFGYSLVDTVVEGVRSKSVNLCDNSNNIHGYYSPGGLVDSNDYTSSPAIAVNVGETYYGRTYTKDGTLLNGVCYETYANASDTVAIREKSNGTSITINAGENYIRVRNFYADATQSINNNIKYMVNKGSSPLTYSDYKTDTLSLSSPVTLRSAGSVAEVLDVQTGKKTRPSNRIDLSDLVWDYNSTNAYFYATLSDMKVVDSGNVMPNFTSAIYEVITSRNNNSWADAKDKSIGTRQTTNYVCFKDLSKTASDLVDGHASWLEGKLFNYELATPLSDEQVCDPIIDNTIYTEGGGTTRTIQSQTPVIDNCLDVGYLAV